MGFGVRNVFGNKLLRTHAFATKHLHGIFHSLQLMGHLHHLAHFLKLFHHSIDFNYGCATAFGYALTAACIYDFGICTLFFSHGLYYGLN